MTRKLTQKQENFAQKYVELGNASEAYRQCYNAGNMTNEVIWVKACELLKSGSVSVRVLEIQEEARERNQVTIDSLTKELDESRKYAIELEQIPASISATMGKAKLHGLIVDKQKVDTKVNLVNDLLDTIDGNTAGLPESTD